MPNFGFGIKPFGPKILPTRPTAPIMSGVAIKRWKSIFPAKISFIKSSSPTISAPAFLASVAFGPLAKTATRKVLPVPAGNVTAPRTIWSDCFGSTPKCTEISTVSSNLAVAPAFITAMASSKSYTFFSTAS